ncbi:hypothetical protein ABZX75_16890, partial [Streptomyces sp. NPDC003038]|uniref:hypothetical protein n=1 Tax=unclassified Streptomyces TaxID=2593676 RepID=UPI0033A599E7
TGYQLLALIFGTLLSSQGTDASFVLTSAHRLGFSSGLRSSFFVSDSIRSLRTRFPRRFPGSRFRVSLSGDSDSIRSSPPDFTGLES